MLGGGTPNISPVDADCCAAFPTEPRLKWDIPVWAPAPLPKLKPPVMLVWLVAGVAGVEPNTKPEGGTCWLAGVLLDAEPPSPKLPVMPGACAVPGLPKFNLGAFTLDRKARGIRTIFAHE